MKQQHTSADHEEQALSLIRDWQAYLRARQTLARPLPAADPFEASEADIERLHATTLLRALPAERRRLFEAALAERKQHWHDILEAGARTEHSHHATLVDPDVVDAETVRECVQLAAGQGHPSGTGYVRYPAAPTEPVTWYDAYVPQLAGPPADAAYELATPGTGRRARAGRVLAALALLPLLGWLAWTLAAPETGAATSQPQAYVNDSALAGWASSRVVLRGDTTLPALQLHSASGAAWPTDGLAYRRGGVGLPVRLCVPQQVLESATTLELPGDGAAPDRAYSLSADAAPGDALALVVEACENPSSVRYGTLQETRPALPGMPGTRATLGDTTFKLTSVAVEGAGQNASLPADTAQVILDIETSAAGLDWVALAPTLRVADGQTYTGPQVESRSNGAILRYLVALPRQALDAEWRIGPAADGMVARWAVMLQPPPNHAAMLRRFVHVQRVVAESADTLRVTLQYAGPQPLLLETRDMRLEQADVLLPPPDVSGIETPLTTGETREIVISLPPDIPGTLTLSIGSSFFRIER